MLRELSRPRKKNSQRRVHSTGRLPTKNVDVTFISKSADDFLVLAIKTPLAGISLVRPINYAV